MIDTLEPVKPELRQLIAELEHWRAPLKLDALTAGCFDRLWGQLAHDAEANSQNEPQQEARPNSRGGEGKPWYSVNPGKEGTREVTPTDVANLRTWWEDRIVPQDFITDIGDRFDTANAYQLLLDVLSVHEVGTAEDAEKARRLSVKVIFNEDAVWVKKDPKNKISFTSFNSSTEQADRYAVLRLKFLQLFAKNPELHIEVPDLWRRLSPGQPMTSKSPAVSMAKWADKFKVSGKPLFEHSNSMARSDSYFRLNPDFKIVLEKETQQLKPDTFPESNLPVKFDINPNELYEAGAYFFESQIRDKFERVGIAPVSLEAVEPLERFRKRRVLMVMPNNEVAARARQAERLRTREVATKKLVKLIGETTKFVDFLESFKPTPEDPEYLFRRWLEQFRIGYERDLLNRVFPGWMPGAWAPKPTSTEE